MSARSLGKKAGSQTAAAVAQHTIIKANCQLKLIATGFNADKKEYEVAEWKKNKYGESKLFLNKLLANVPKWEKMIGAAKDLGADVDAHAAKLANWNKKLKEHLHKLLKSQETARNKRGKVAKLDTLELGETHAAYAS